MVGESDKLTFMVNNIVRHIWDDLAIASYHTAVTHNLNHTEHLWDAEHKVTTVLLVHASTTASSRLTPVRTFIYSPIPFTLAA
jgi:hypothetical protein